MTADVHPLPRPAEDDDDVLVDRGAYVIVLVVVALVVSFVAFCAGVITGAQMVLVR